MVGAGEIGNGSCTNLLCDAYSGILGKEDGPKSYGKSFMSNPLYDQYVSWGNIKSRQKNDNKYQYTIVPEEVAGRDYMSRSGDSGAGILAIDPVDHQYKLISVLTTDNPGQRTYQGDVFLDLNSTTETMGATNVTAINKWVKDNKLDGSRNLTNAFSVFTDPWFPEPPSRVPDNPSNKCGTDGEKTSTSTPTGKSPKEVIAQDSFPANNTFTLINDLDQEAMVNLNGSLFKTPLDFQDRIPPHSNVSRQMPSGFKPELLQVNTGSDCYLRKIKIDINNGTNSSDFGISMKPGFNGTKTTYLKTSTSTTASSVTPQVQQGVQQGISIGGYGGIKSTPQSGNCTLPDHYTSPFRFSPRPEPVGRSPFFGTLKGAATSGAIFVGSMFLLAACLRICSSKSSTRTKKEQKLAKDVTNASDTFNQR